MLIAVLCPVGLAAAGWLIWAGIRAVEARPEPAPNAQQQQENADRCEYWRPM